MRIFNRFQSKNRYASAKKKKNLRKNKYYYYLKDECLLDFAKNCHGCYDIYKEQTCQFLAKSMKNLYH